MHAVIYFPARLSLVFSQLLHHKAPFNARQIYGSVVFNRNKKQVVNENIVNHDQQDETLAHVAQQYPQAHGSLNNIMAVVAKELKTPTKSLDITFKAEMKSKHLTGWTCSCHLKWPSVISFSATGKTKQEASRTASLKVLQWLMVQGKVKGNQPVMMDAVSVSNLKKINLHVETDPLSAQSVKQLLQKYQENILKIIDSTKQTSHLRVSSELYRTEDSINRISETQLQRMKVARNRLLQRNAFARIDENDTHHLPIFNFRNEILVGIRDNQVLVIKGEPGCGKSTQVPQYILDESAMANRGCDTSIIVTQPRRISAISLAERVSSERGEEVGDCVGYQVRFKSRLPKPIGGSIRFCSSGILLKILQSNPDLDGFSHVILDEAHERDVNTDMLLLLLRRILIKNPNLKLIIMSATINPQLFQSYYPKSAALLVPGFTHPVKSYFLDDIDQIPLPQTRMSQEQRTPRVIHNEIASLIQWIHKNKSEGAILCFLPGWQDIKGVLSHLERSSEMREEAIVLPLHSRLSLEDQSRVFRRPPADKRKIVLSTNVAETSVTIDDVGYVVDTGIHKEERLSADKSSAVLDDLWISQANVNQRRGRAGRVRPGESFHLYSNNKYLSLPQFPTPELHRVPLQKVVLDIKTYNENESAEAFLSQMPEPPSAIATTRAVQDLIDLGALTGEEALTPLGRRIARFTTDPRLSKALIHATVFRCLDSMLTITSILSSDAEFFSGALEDRADIADIKRRHASNSDHMAVLNLFKDWTDLINNEEYDEIFCIRNMLRRNTLQLTTRLRQHLVEQLQEAKMVADDVPLDLVTTPSWLLGVLLSGTESFLFQRKWDYKNGRIKLNSASTVTEAGSKASLASDCSCHKTQLPTPFLVYYRKQESAVRRTCIVRDASCVPAITIPVFLPQKARHNNNNNLADVVTMDDQRRLPYRLTAKSSDAKLLQEVQSVLQDLVSYFVIVEGEGEQSEEYKTVSEYRDQLITAVAQLINNSCHSVI